MPDSAALDTEARETFGDAAARPPRDLGRTILRNTLALTAGGWLTKAANFVFIIYVVRVLGEVGLGWYATVVAFVGLFSVFFELGLAQYVERTIAQGRGSPHEMFWNLVALRLVLATVGVGGITLLAVAAGYERRLVIGVLLFTLTFMLAAFLVPLMTVLTGNERFDLSTGAQLTGQLITIAVGAALLWSGAGFYALLFTGFVAMPVQIGLCVWLVRRHHLGPLTFRIAPASWPRFVRASVPFGLTSLALTFNFNVDTVIIGLFHEASDVGWYNASYRLVFNVVGIVGGFLVAVTPSLAREHVHDPARVTRWVRGSVHWMLLFALPAAAAMSLLAPRVVATLYGGDFAPAGPVLALIAWDVPLLLLLSFFGNVTAATGLEHPAAKIYLASAGLNLVLNLLLIPRFGEMAAAGVTIATDSISVCLFFVLLREMAPVGRPAAGHFSRVLLATGLMSVAMLVTWPLPLPVVGAAGAAMFLSSALALRLIPIATIVRLASGRAQTAQEAR